jgi:hypothetical protein
MKLLAIYFIFNMFVMGTPVPNPISQTDITHSKTKAVYCSKIIKTILTTMLHSREAYGVDFNYRQQELLKIDNFFQKNK